jgi:lysophospholipase L1-like esterase
MLYIVPRQSFLTMRLWLIVSVIAFSICAPNFAPGAEKNYYYLHISSFRAKKNALQDAERLRNKGYKTVTRYEQVADLGYWYRVYIGPFSSLAEAKVTREELKRRNLDGYDDYVAIHKTGSLILGEGDKARERSQSFLQEGDVVVFYGDSITDQKFYCWIVEQAFRKAARKYNSENNVKFYIMGYGGKTAKWGFEHINEVLIKKPTVVTLLWGMNDASGLEFPERQRLIEHKLALAGQVRALQKAGIRPVILTVPPVDEELSKSHRNSVLDKYAQVQMDVALSTGADFVDVRSAFKAAAVNTELPTFTVDGIHPDIGGHRAIAEAILDAWGIPL